MTGKAAERSPTRLDHHPLHAEDIQAIVGARHGDPFAVLGPHPCAGDGEQLLSIRAFVPGADKIWVVPRNGPPIEGRRLHREGFFECVLGPVGLDFRYRLKVQRSDGRLWEFEDAYRFGRVLSDFDCHLLSEGTHYKTYEKLGAHVMEIDGVRGVHFAVWAPNARRVSVVGPFNDWDGRRHPMRNLGSTGFWEVFIPDLVEEISTSTRSSLVCMTSSA